MNSNSILCNFISQHPDNWEVLLKEKKVRVKKEENSSYAIFNYLEDALFSDPVVQEARGIILDLDTLDVVCWPFRKFCNWQEPYCDEIDWNSAVMQDKIDGSIVKLWYDRKRDKWQFSTNGCIRAENTEISSCNGISFMDVIQKAEGYATIKSYIESDTMNKNFTYILELTGPEVQIVIKYDHAKLWHTGARNNITGQELRAKDMLPDMDHPKEWVVSSMDDCVNAAEALNADYQKTGITKEGFVVLDQWWNRIKVKSPTYIMMHHAFDGGNISYKRVLLMIRHDDVTFDQLCETYPASAHIFRWYQWQMAELSFNAAEVCRKARALNAEFAGNRKAIAAELKKEPLQKIAFKHLDNGKSAEELLGEMEDYAYIRLIKKYGEG